VHGYLYLTYVFQCAIPVFDGLLPEPHNTAILKLLYQLAFWHGLAKLRIHTDLTLNMMEKVTVALGKELRKFSTRTCADYNTHELKREVAARNRKEKLKKERQNQKKKSNEEPQDKSSAPTPSSSSRLGVNSKQATDASRPKTLNLNTYKVHALGDYVNTIRRFGTTDSYTTQTVSAFTFDPQKYFCSCFSTWQGELQHRTSKARYARTSRKNFIKQMTNIERRQTRIRRLKERLAKSDAAPDFDIAHTPDMHHHIGKSQNDPEHIGLFVHRHAGDPAVKVGYVTLSQSGTLANLIVFLLEDFVRKLKQHLLPRLQHIMTHEAPAPNVGTQHNTTTTNGSGADQQDYHRVLIRKDLMYSHKIARFNYTTYDVRRAQDIIHPDTSRCTIMVLNDPEDEESFDQCPFTYARIIGVFHVNAILAGPAGGVVDCRPRRLEFLWVRWYRCVSPMHAWESGKLDRVQFPPMEDEDAFGFLDPRDVLRASHIVPVFRLGQIHKDRIGLSKIARDNLDWCSYYVNRCVCPLVFFSAVWHCLLTRQIC
jgi:hypothetical protein